MHAEAHAYVAGVVAALGPFRSVLEIGARDINGSVRPLFGDTDYTAIDIAPGPGVDLVADAAEWEPHRKWDAVVCCEVFEHTARWPRILQTMTTALAIPGVLIVTAACDPRAPHSAIDGGPVRSGEHYANLDPEVLWHRLSALGFTVEMTTDTRGDVYVTAT